MIATINCRPSVLNLCDHATFYGRGAGQLQRLLSELTGAVPAVPNYLARSLAGLDRRSH